MPIAKHSKWENLWHALKDCSQVLLNIHLSVGFIYSVPLINILRGGVFKIQSNLIFVGLIFWLDWIVKWHI